MPDPLSWRRSLRSIPDARAQPVPICIQTVSNTVIIPYPNEVGYLPRHTCKDAFPAPARPVIRPAGSDAPRTGAVRMAKRGERNRRDVRAAVLLAVAAFVIYNVNLRTIATGDSLPARFIPFAIWKAGTVRLDPVLEATRQKHASSYWILPARDGGHASMYPIVAPLLVTPLYAPAALYLALRGWPEESLEQLG